MGQCISFSLAAPRSSSASGDPPRPPPLRPRPPPPHAGGAPAEAATAGHLSSTPTASAAVNPDPSATSQRAAARPPEWETCTTADSLASCRNRDSAESSSSTQTSPLGPLYTALLASCPTTD